MFISSKTFYVHHFETKQILTENELIKLHLSSKSPTALKGLKTIVSGVLGGKTNKSKHFKNYDQIIL